MLISKIQAMDELDIMWDSDDECEEFNDHTMLRERLRKTLYFGKTPAMDQTSLPMTELAVEYFQEAIPRELGRVDMYWASSFTRRASVSPCAMMLGMLYIERLRHKNPDYLKKMSSEELFLISMMLASKYLYDEGVTEEVYNDEWAASSNLDLEDINQLEMDFLSAIDWSLYVGNDTFTDLLLCTERCIAMKEAYRRGYLTYTDLFLLLDNSKMAVTSWKMFAEMCKVLAVCSLAYSMGACTMVASTIAVASIQQSMMTSVPAFLPTFLPALLPTMSDTSDEHPPVTASGDSMVLCENKTEVLSNKAVEVNPPHPGSDLLVDDFWNIRPTQKPRNVMSQFLTLALVKDTLMAFVFGRDRRDSCSAMGQNCNDDDVGHPQDQSTCRDPCKCPHCPGKVTKSDKIKKDHSPRRYSVNNYPMKVSCVCHPSLWIQSHCASCGVCEGSDDGHKKSDHRGKDQPMPCVSVWEEMTSVLGNTRSMVQPVIAY